MKDEKECTWCNRKGHHANHCPDPKPPYVPLDFGLYRVKVDTGTGNYAEAVYMPSKNAPRQLALVRLTRIDEEIHKGEV